MVNLLELVDGPLNLIVRFTEINSATIGLALRPLTFLKHRLTIGADLNKINRVLGFNSKYKISKGISNFVDWVKTQEIQKDNYEKSVLELRNKGLIK